jgi:serine/threonine protein kinase
MRLPGFEIVDILGTGGMGEVYRARDTRLGREVAIKLLPRELADDPDRRARFERESRLLAALNHPHVAAIHGVEEIDGRPALVLELIEGPTLADRLASGPLAPEQALQIARDLAGALEAAHNKGVVHRDLKPANIKTTLDGVVKLLDFGLAKAMPRGGDPQASSRAPAGEPHTHDGLILGTGGYMSPEQARGQQVDKRTDIWAFGCVLYEMLSGRRAFAGDTISDTIAAVLEREPDWLALPATIVPEVETLLRRCLQKDPRRRLHDIADARLVIEEALDWSERPKRPHRRSSRPARAKVALALGAIVVTGLVAFALWRLRGDASDRVVESSPTYLSLALPEGVGLQSAPAVSPDGSSIAFVGTDRKQSRLYVRRLSSPQAVDIPGTEGARQPFWSPDGQWLAFFAGSKLRKVAVDGGAPVDICAAAEASGGSWGTRGVIVFTPHLIDAPVYRVAAEGGTPEPVTRLDESHADNSHRWPVFLPDGVHFLYFIRSSEDGRRGVYLGRVDQDAALPGERVIESESEAYYVPSATESGGALVTVVAAGVHIQPFDASSRRLIGHPRVLDVRAGVSTPHERAMFSASPHILALATMPISRRNRLASVARDGSDVHVWPEFEPHNWPRLSPDGTRLVFQRVHGQRGTADLWVKDLVRGTETRVSAPPAHGLLPVWSPGGDRLAFLWGRPGTATLAIGAADGTRTVPSQACPFPRCDPTDWSPDGRTLIVTVYTPKGTDLWSVPVEPTADQQARPLFAEPHNERDARFSPDGEWVAYVSDDSGRAEVSVRRHSGRDRIVISSDGGSQPVWRRDGAELFYVDGQGHMHAAAIKQGGGALVAERSVRLPVPAIGTGHWGTQYDVSRDGRRVYYVDRTQPDPSTRIEVVLGWTSLVR